MPYTVLKEKNVGTILLDNPAKLNAFTHHELLDIRDALENWRSDPEVHWILLEGSGKAYCAGGDVVTLYKNSLKGESPLTFFKKEFEVDSYFHHYPKPLLVHYKGASMGGGLGLAANATIQIADESTLWAMPESKIGFFPDVGLGYFLSQLPRAEALYLTLTPAILSGADAVTLGLATDYIKAQRWPELRSALIEHPTDYLPKEDLIGALKSIVRNFRTPLPEETDFSRRRAAIQHYFSQETLLELMAALRGGRDDFAKMTYSELEKRSPLALAIIFDKYDAGKHWTREKTLAKDLTLIEFLWQNGSMPEGIRTNFIDKGDTPQFTPAKIEEVDFVDVRRRLL